MLSYSIPVTTTMQDATNHKIRYTVFGEDAKRDSEYIKTCKFATWYTKIKTDHKRAIYLRELTFPPVRQLRFQTMPTEYLAGRFSSRYIKQCLCICEAGHIEDPIHCILYCPLYNSPRAKFILPFQTTLEGQSDDFKIRWLLADGDKFISYRKALFALAARKIRTAFLNHTTKEVKQNECFKS